VLCPSLCRKAAASSLPVHDSYPYSGIWRLSRLAADCSDKDRIDLTFISSAPSSSLKFWSPTMTSERQGAANNFPIIRTVIDAR
jgi:hypothetical protein